MRQLSGSGRGDRGPRLGAQQSRCCGRTSFHTTDNAPELLLRTWAMFVLALFPIPIAAVGCNPENTFFKDGRSFDIGLRRVTRHL
jgi:hypothetical protein